jgi:hypothetical protein
MASLTSLAPICHLLLSSGCTHGFKSFQVSVLSSNLLQCYNSELDLTIVHMVSRVSRSVCSVAKSFNANPELNLASTLFCTYWEFWSILRLLLGSHGTACQCHWCWRRWRQSNTLWPRTLIRVMTVPPSNCQSVEISWQFYRYLSLWYILILFFEGHWRFESSWIWSIEQSHTCSNRSWLEVFWNVHLLWTSVAEMVQGFFLV